MPFPSSYELPIHKEIKMTATNEATKYRRIYRDLDIDMSDIISDPVSFQKKVVEAANRLIEIMASDSSISGARKEAKENAVRNEAARVEAETIYAVLWGDEINRIGENEAYDNDVVYHLSRLLKACGEELQAIFEQRASNRKILSSSTNSEKRLAANQYAILRQAWANYIGFIRVIHDAVDLKPLAAKSGNFGNGQTSTYVAWQFDGEIYHNYRAVARLLQEETENPFIPSSLSDFLNWLEANDNFGGKVVQKEVRL
jgi:hypothetical protein